MAQTSAGLMMYRVRDGRLQVLLVHPGGPYWRNKDEGAWTLPKGEPAGGEDLLSAARREFEEELGIVPEARDARFTELRPVKQKGGKVVYAWCFEGDCDTTAVRSNTFTMEWPPKSGRQAEFPEVDRAEFFDLPTAGRKINPAQIPLLEQLAAIRNDLT
jgi:predicted NUDIX family NTP pyrophosphohydrolase